MMLPKVTHPIFNFIIPSEKNPKKKHNFRYFLVKEEKILLMAKQSADETDIFNAVKQIVQNCALDSDFDTNKITMFDLEYLFLKLRMVSVSDKVKPSYIDNDDGQSYDFEVDLNKVEVKFPDKEVSNNIKINNTTGIMLRYPPASLYDDKKFLAALNSDDDSESMFELILNCIDQVYDEDSVYDRGSFTNEELADYLDELPLSTIEGIKEFLMNTPKLEHVIEYKNANGKDRKITLNTLSDFFTF